MASIGYQLHGHTVAALCLTECSSCTWCATGFSWTLTVTRCLKIGLMRVDQCVHTQLTQVYVARCMGGSNIQPLWRVRGSHPHTQCNTFRRLVNADAQASMTQTCICTCDETSKITRRISGHHQLHARSNSIHGLHRAQAHKHCAKQWHTTPFEHGLLFSELQTQMHAWPT
jgi:hypothetical protein